MLLTSMLQPTITAPITKSMAAKHTPKYRHTKLNIAIIAGSLIALVAFWLLIRHQVAVSDKQFLRSMIPHHGGAILMCHDASITDPEIKALCESIKSSQQSEIEQMKRKLKELEAR